ncbi:MAG TPA: EAL domain-containing protein [Rhodanobacteraceae bacterium]|nr:EAL domain-containing protein [Rhodanobacteraceae bacterium]
MTGVASSGLLQRLQNEILEMVARGAALPQIADLVCVRAETLAPGVLCSILTVDTQGFVHPLAAPSLPSAYSAALEGLSMGPSAGSCGTAAYRGEPVEVVDIANDPLWADYKALALMHGLFACWSSPIKARDGRVVGTFAFYYREPRGPSDIERRIVETCVQICAIAIEHDEAHSRIHQLAYYDTLTRLPNRTQFLDRVAAILANMARGSTVSLLHVDLDDFKAVNDTLGHRIGDLLLEAVTQRLVASADAAAFLARLGSDEFGVVLISADGRSEAGALAERIIDAIGKPFELDDERVAIGVSIGIAHAAAGSMDLEELSRCAGMAVYVAKREGGDTYRFFSPEMDVVMQLRRQLKQDVRHALAAGEFSLVYQPIVALETGELVAVEALLRWQHPVRGAVPPSDFIPIAEEMGFIGALGDWALHEACAAAAEWPREVRVAVNLSPLQLDQPGLVLDVVGALNRNGLSPSRLELEITESALLAESASTRMALHDLHGIGIALSMDDFGTGYSSLRSLRSFPVDKIKIDQSFVRDIGRNTDSAAIIRAVIGLAHDLGLKTAAEGIETEGQLQWLALQGCTQGQGNFFSEPLRREQMRALLEAMKSMPLTMPRRHTPTPG